MALLKFILACLPLLVFIACKFPPKLACLSLLPLLAMSILKKIWVRRIWKLWETRMHSLVPMNPEEMAVWKIQLDSLEWRPVHGRWKKRFEKYDVSGGKLQ